eukprot:7967-Heterococcus_DN1.PRE.2
MPHIRVCPVADDTHMCYPHTDWQQQQNASVIKLQPKKAGVAVASNLEKKLMQELEQMKALVATLLANNNKASGSVTDNATDNATTTVTKQHDAVTDDAQSKADAQLIADSSNNSADSATAAKVLELQELLHAKQKQLQDVLTASTMNNANTTATTGNTSTSDTTTSTSTATTAASVRQDDGLEGYFQMKEFKKRGISLAHFEGNTQLPHFINLDEDPFRSKRFLYILRKHTTVFGPKGDMQIQNVYWCEVMYSTMLI